MAIARPLAALSSGLLARKGQARPAMRRQTQSAASAATGDDLGWNDMGEEVPAAAPLPPVLRERAQLAEDVARTAHDAPARAGRSAFTLRLDAERHLRLRLACAVRGRSAQQLVTQALDALLDTMPDVEALRGQLPAGDRSPVRGGK